MMPRASMIARQSLNSDLIIDGLKILDYCRAKSCAGKPNRWRAKHEWYMRSMRQYAVFRGRAARAEFWGFVAVTFGLVFVGMVIDALVSPEVQAGSKKDPAPIFTALIVVAHFVPAFAVTVRRLHDTERSGLDGAAQLHPAAQPHHRGVRLHERTRGPNPLWAGSTRSKRDAAVPGISPIPVSAIPRQAARDVST